MPERDDDGAGQRREIDHELGLEALVHVMQHVGEHEPALGVGVDDLDGLAGHRVDDVARALRLAVRHVLDEADGADRHSTLALRAASACIRPTTQAAPAMSPFMSSMLAAGLIEMPPVSKHTPLPMKATGASPFLPPFQRMITHAAFVLGALADAEQRVHAELLHRRDVEHLDLDAELLQAERRGARIPPGRGRSPAR